MNLNKFARRVTLAEGKKVQISIAQVKEVIRIVLSEMAALPPEEAIKMIKRYAKRDT